jgi:hypothetical protein
MMWQFGSVRIQRAGLKNKEHFHVAVYLPFLRRAVAIGPRHSTRRHDSVP